MLLIRLATLNGWQLHTAPGFAGERIYWLQRGTATVRARHGRTLAEVATPLFLDAIRHDYPTEEHTGVSPTVGGA